LNNELWFKYVSEKETIENKLGLVYSRRRHHHRFSWISIKIIYNGPLSVLVAVWERGCGRGSPAATLINVW
jgi:hypothetical protein